MKQIRSKDNPKYKETLRLLRKKYRDQTGMFLIEGPKPVTDAVRDGSSIDTVFIRSSATGSEDAAALEQICDAAGVTCISLDDVLFDRLSDTEHSQGVLAKAIKPKSAKADGRLVILDRLQDPGNIGTIIRTAEAAGFRSLITIKGTGDIYAPKTVRAAAGSLLRVNVFEGFGAEDAVRYCKERDLRIIASDLEESVRFTDADMSGDIALVIGNEGSGISDAFRQAADNKVRIPMEGEIESLNAAVAAGILMYEAKRQADAAGKVK